MKIGLLGGTFDPPHMGHVLIARQVLDFAGVDEVWFLPNYRQNPPKPSSPVEDRLAMTKLIALLKTRVSLLEIEHMLDGDTIHILPFLPPEHEFTFIMGSDQLPTFAEWNDWERLLRELPVLVFPRYGHPTEPLYQGMKVVSDSSLITSNISSTKIRERVRRGLSIEHFVPVDVFTYIKDHKLYRDV